MVENLPNDLKACRELKQEKVVLGLLTPLRDIQSVLKSNLYKTYGDPDKKLVVACDTVKMIAHVNDLKTMPSSKNIQWQEFESASNKKVILLPKYNTDPDQWTHDEFQQLTDIGYDVCQCLIQRFYEDLSYYEALRLLLPSDVTVIPSSFETVGHIAHFNLLPEQLPYRHSIGRVLLDKNPMLKTVINKTAKIVSEFRTPSFELIAGEPNYETTLVENGYKFRVNYEKVYWNSRLSNEREKVAELVDHDAVVCDVMAGVGGFGIYCAKRKNCAIYSNDLNPDAIKYMETNARLNGVTSQFIPFCLDGRVFIKTMINSKHCAANLCGSERDDRKRRKTSGDKVYFLLNLPEIAISFLDAFVGAKHWEIETTLKKIHVICYCFSAAESTDSIRQRILKMLGTSNAVNIKAIEKVRDVAPAKLMYRCHMELKSTILESELKSSSNHQLS